jgi:hypothetical protein
LANPGNPNKKIWKSQFLFSGLLFGLPGFFYLDFGVFAWVFNLPIHMHMVYNTLIKLVSAKSKPNPGSSNKKFFLDYRSKIFKIWETQTKKAKKSEKSKNPENPKNKEQIL